jgi:hypothetical protein
MYRIMDRDTRIDFVWQTARANYFPDRTKVWDGGSQDAATALAIAIDQDVLASRLLDCADIHFHLARCALTPTGALRESARALQLMEKAGEAKRFANFMLGCAMTFERALGADEGTDDWRAASAAWSDLMADGIFSPDMYEGLEDAMDELSSMFESER